MPDRERQFIPENTFDINVKIKELNYTNDLANIRIISSILSPYQIVELNLLLDSNDIILENLYGQDPIKVNVRIKGSGGDLLEQTDLDLMMLDSGYELTNKAQISDGKQEDKQPFYIRTICRQPFETMTTMVNEIYEEITIRDILKDLVQNKTGATLQFDSKGENTNTITQAIIPPSTLYKIIKENSNEDDLEGFIDKQFGYFEGVPLVFCRYDNTVQIKNLSHKINSGGGIIVHHLASERDNKDIINESINGSTFYTYSPISINYSGNKKVARLANEVHYIVKPSDTLYEDISFNMVDIARNYSLSPKEKKPEIIKSVSNRKKYNVGSCGDEENKTFAISNLSRMLADLTAIEIGLEGVFQIKNIIEIGEPVKLKTQTVEYSELSGNYILSSSIIDLNRGDENTGTQWNTVARLRLIRTEI